MSIAPVPSSPNGVSDTHPLSQRRSRLLIAGFVVIALFVAFLATFILYDHANDPEVQRQVDAALEQMEQE